MMGVECRAAVAVACRRGASLLGPLYRSRVLLAPKIAWDFRPELQLDRLPIIFTKTILGPDGGCAGEERILRREVAERHVRDNVAVHSNEENEKMVWTYNPDTDQYDTPIERSDEFLAFIQKKRQWLDVYWTVNQGYLLFERQSWGGGFVANVPLRQKDIAQKLWQMYKVRTDPRLIQFREKDRKTGIQDLGHNFCWLYLPGAEALKIDREVYDNKRVKVRVFLRASRLNALY
jgi:hypothetical protein